MGNDHPSIVPYQLLQCADGPLAVACGNDGQFVKLCGALGSAGGCGRALPDQQRPGRNRLELIPLLEGALARAGGQYWQDTLNRAGVPAGQVATIKESLEFAESLGLEPTIPVHDASGEITGRQIRHPITWTPPLEQRRTAPPALGRARRISAAVAYRVRDRPTASSGRKQAAEL